MAQDSSTPEKQSLSPKISPGKLLTYFLALIGGLAALGQIYNWVEAHSALIEADVYAFRINDLRGVWPSRTELQTELLGRKLQSAGECAKIIKKDMNLTSDFFEASTERGKSLGIVSVPVLCNQVFDLGNAEIPQLAAFGDLLDASGIARVAIKNTGNKLATNVRFVAAGAIRYYLQQGEKWIQTAATDNGIKLADLLPGVEIDVIVFTSDGAYYDSYYNVDRYFSIGTDAGPSKTNIYLAVGLSDQIDRYGILAVMLVGGLIISGILFWSLVLFAAIYEAITGRKFGTPKRDASLESPNSVQEKSDN